MGRRPAIKRMLRCRNTGGFYRRKKKKMPQVEQTPEADRLAARNIHVYITMPAV